MVHDFLNTRASQENGADLLGDATRATQWTRTVIRAWARPNNRHYPLQPLTNHDAERLRQLRDDLLTSLTGMPAEMHTVGAATFTLAATGEISWAPSGAGWRWVYGAILGEVLLSQHDGLVAAPQALSKWRVPGDLLRQLVEQQRRAGTTPEPAERLIYNRTALNEHPVKST